MSPQVTEWSGSTRTGSRMPNTRRGGVTALSSGYGEFEHEIALPQGAVEATYSNGVLEVRIPCPAKT
jgi:HSP20 family molecular chaperone IbpA